MLGFVRYVRSIYVYKLSDIGPAKTRVLTLSVKSNVLHLHLTVFLHWGEGCRQKSQLYEKYYSGTLSQGYVVAVVRKYYLAAKINCIRIRPRSAARFRAPLHVTPWDCDGPKNFTLHPVVLLVKCGVSAAARIKIRHRRKPGGDRQSFRPQWSGGRLPKEVHYQRGTQVRGLFCTRKRVGGANNELSLHGEVPKWHFHLRRSHQVNGLWFPSSSP